jgi:hypothetical protein
MEVEILIAIVVLFSAIGSFLVLWPHGSKAPKRRITSSRNSYGRGYGR